MNKTERLEYILKLEQEQEEERFKQQLLAAKRESQQQRLQFIISFTVAQTINSIGASLGLCKRNGDD